MQLPLVFFDEASYNNLDYVHRRSFVMAVKIEKNTIIGDVLDIAPHML